MMDLFPVANLAGSTLERLYIIIVESDQEMFRISIAREMERFYGLQCKGWVPSWSRSNKLSEQERLYLEYSVSIGRRQERLYMYLECSIGQRHSTVMATRWFVLVVSCFLELLFSGMGSKSVVNFFYWFHQKT
jgi:hypothetical protein